MRALRSVVILGFFVLAACRPAASPSEIPPEELKLPEGSADYKDVLAEVLLYKKGRIDFDELKSRIVARKLPPHSLGCGYTMQPVPAPPPGTKFEPALMPSDWKNTFGEVAMTYWAGKLTQEEYDALHAAAHPTEKR